MRDKIVECLKGISLKNSNHKARQMVADRLGGILTSGGRYVKFGDTEYRIVKNPDNAVCGWEVLEMDWEIGNDWRFSKPY